MSIYGAAIRRMQQRAEAEFRSTAVGKLLTEVDRLRRRGTAGQNELLRLSKQLSRLGSRSSLWNELQRTGLGQIVGEIDRYARRGLKQAVLEELLGALGPVGGLMQMFLRPGGKQVVNSGRELQAAADMLRAFGYRVEAPPRGKGTQRVETDIDRSKRLLESLGFTVTPPPAEKSQPARPEIVDAPGGGGKRGGGTGSRFKVSAGGVDFLVPPGDPLITGEWIQVSSSNVYAIAFIWNNAAPTKGTLRIRFLNHRKGAKSARGPVYHYYDVHPALFQDFRKAASKGRWVWDNMRIRGTVSGHRYRYMLTMLSSDGYVPRQATRLGNEEWFIRRNVRSATTSRGGNIQLGQDYRSQLGDEFVKYWDKRNGTPNRGKGAGPNRGKPNRGR